MLWFNGRFADEATSNATSAGALLGWGVFTTIGVWNAQPFALPQHLARLQHDAAHCEIEYSIDDETLDSALHELISRHKITRGMARISITKRGDGRWNTQSGSDVSILVRPIKDETVPAKITTSPFRMHSKRALCGVKSTSYLDYQLAWNEAQSRGFDEAILLNEQSSVCEGARSNLFWTRDGNLFTPSLSTGCCQESRALWFSIGRAKQSSKLTRSSTRPSICEMPTAFFSLLPRLEFAPFPRLVKADSHRTKQSKFCKIVGAMR